MSSTVVLRYFKFVSWLSQVMLITLIHPTTLVVSSVKERLADSKQKFTLLPPTGWILFMFCIKGMSWLDKKNKKKQTRKGDDADENFQLIKNILRPKP